jgi:hypothetical protein
MATRPQSALLVRLGTQVQEVLRRACDRTVSHPCPVIRPDQQEHRQAIQDSCGAAEDDDFDGLTGEEYTERVRHGWSRLWAEPRWGA